MNLLLQLYKFIYKSKMENFCFVITKIVKVFSFDTRINNIIYLKKMLIFFFILKLINNFHLKLLIILILVKLT